MVLTSIVEKPVNHPKAAQNRAGTPLLEARNVHRVLGSGDAQAHVLRGVNLTIREGEYVSIVGVSGSGKSTLLYLLGGLDRPSTRWAGSQSIQPSPQVLIDGQSTTDLGEAALARLRNEKVGFVFQFHYLLKEFSAQENVALPALKLGRLSRGGAMERSAALLEKLGLGNKLRRRADRLSGGEQQRVAIARALVNAPPALLLDEPTGNLDRANGEIVAQTFAELSSQGQTIVMVTHDVSLASRAARTITMQDGQIIHDSGDTDTNAGEGS